MANKDFIQVQFQNISGEQSEILVALLSNIGFEGFEENDNLLNAFIAAHEFNKKTLDAIVNSLNLSYSTYVIEQQNWNARWERSFEPVIIGDFAAVRADFHQPVQHVQHEIIITPKMSFGTGHHATTYLMMEQMSHLDFTNKTVLDFGTGTGVLAILAEKMGAKEIIAIDNDDWSIDNAKENLIQNQSKKIIIQKAETITPDSKYDVILANINLNVILEGIAAMGKICNSGASVLLSGFLVTDLMVIKEALAANLLVFNTVTKQKDWICICAVK